MAPPSLRLTSMAIPLLLVLAAAAADSPSGTCLQTLIHADGRIETSVVADDGAGASASSRSAGQGHASSSVSASSSSGEGSSASSSSSSDGTSRSVSVTRDADGCRIVIDERPR